MEGASGGASSSSSSDFVRKLYKMLENPSDESVVRWGNEGDSFVVLENEKFTKHILPKHFKHSNFASFVRQLNKYDFHKVRHSNEENGQSPYGPGAWEFKHPDFKMNNKDALDNIRRKAPAARKPNQNPEDMMIPTQQMDMMNSQLVATQQQLQQLQERYAELSIHHSMLVQEVIGLQKTVVNHEHVMQNVMSFLHSVDAQRRRDSRLVTPFPQGGGAQDGATIDPHMSSLEDDVPASPLQHASKLLSETNADVILNPRNLEHMNEASLRMNGALTTPPPDMSNLRNGGRPASRSAPNSATSTGSVRTNELDNLVYPVGQNNGIDPTYEAHFNNIPYPLPVKPPDPNDPRLQAEGRKKSTTIDPGWTRPPQILLVEDDPTCRRIGGKFLYAFNCSIDSALDGLEAVNKMSAGAKYDLVLMDIIMPNLDGVSACHLIRQFASTPIVAMTSNIRSDDIAMYFQHGMNDVLPKPFTKEGLLHMLEKHLTHLKKPLAEAVNTTMVAPSAQASTMKEEESPAKSPTATSNWNSPNQVPGVSPGGSTNTDEYMNPAMQGSHPGLYAMQQQSPMAGYGAGAMSMQQQQQQHPQQQPQHPQHPHPQQQHQHPQQQQHQQHHRRQIGDISGGEDLHAAGAAKRQQMYSPQTIQAQTLNPMQRPR